MTGHRPGAKSPAALRTISEVSDELQLPQHILRFWETRFPELRPMQRGGNRRYYRPSDVALCRALKRLLHEEGYTVKGVRRLIAEKGVRSLVDGPATPAVVAPVSAPAPMVSSPMVSSPMVSSPVVQATSSPDPEPPPLLPAAVAAVASRLRAALEQARA